MYHYDKRRVLILDVDVISPTSVARIVSNYQATKAIKYIEDIESTWAHNKVPIILGTGADLVLWRQKLKGRYPIVDISESAACFDSEEKQDPFIEFCHSQGVECGEYITGEKHFIGSKGCFLCEIAKGLGKWENTRVEYNKKVKKPHHMVLFETPNFFVKVEFGCLTPGMVMINSKKHYMSAASIPDEEFGEYEQIRRDVEKLLKAIYGGPIVFFEHGSAPDGGASHKRSIVHFHLHVIPGIRMEKEDLERVGMRTIKDIREVRGKKYLSYQEGVDGQLWVADDPETFIPRQYPRKVIACSQGISYEKSNWRVEPFWDNIFQTYDDLHGYLRENWEQLSPHFQEAMRAFYIAYPLRKREE